MRAIDKVRVSAAVGGSDMVATVVKGPVMLTRGCHRPAKASIQSAWVIEAPAAATRVRRTRPHNPRKGCVAARPVRTAESAREPGTTEWP